MPKKKPKKAQKRKPPQNPVGRPPAPILSEPLVAAALVELRGNVAAVARKFGVHRSSVQVLIGKSEPLQMIQKDAREGMLDDAESALYRAVVQGEAWAVCFLLKTQGKDRGYIERQEHDHKHSGEVKTVTEVIVRNRAEADAILALNGPADVRSPAPKTG